MSAKCLVFAVLVALAAAAEEVPKVAEIIPKFPGILPKFLPPQLPLPEVPVPQISPDGQYSYAFKLSDPITGAITSEVEIQSAAPSNGLPVDPTVVAAKSAGIRGIAPVPVSTPYGPYYNPYYHKSVPYPYNGGYYPYGYPGYFPHY